MKEFVHWSEVVGRQLRASLSRAGSGLELGVRKRGSTALQSRTFDDVAARTNLEELARRLPRTALATTVFAVLTLFLSPSHAHLLLSRQGSPGTASVSTAAGPFPSFAGCPSCYCPPRPCPPRPRSQLDLPASSSSISAISRLASDYPRVRLAATHTASRPTLLSSSPPFLSPSRGVSRPSSPPPLPLDAPTALVLDP